MVQLYKSSILILVFACLNSFQTKAQTYWRQSASQIKPVDGPGAKKMPPGNVLGNKPLPKPEFKSGSTPEAEKKSGYSDANATGAYLTWNGKRSSNWNSQRWKVGLQTGYAGVHGDLSNTYYGAIDDNVLIPPIGIDLKYSVSHTFSLRGNFYKGILSATSNIPPKDTFEFKNRFNTFEVQTVFNLGNLSYLMRWRRSHLYLFTGLGTIQSNISSKSFYPNNPDTLLYRKWNLTVPGGAGIVFNLNSWLDLSLESGLRWARTDSLDYNNYPVHRNRTFDKFSLTTIGLQLKFGNRKERKDHYDWINPVPQVSEMAAKAIQKVDSIVGDDDKDGVPNLYDKDPVTPEGIAVDVKGIPLDSDKDGIPDTKDKEPFSYLGHPVDKDGIMLDEDQDGVPNQRDREPNTPKGALVTANGEAIPLPKEVGKPAIGERLPSVYFDTDKYIIKPEFYDELMHVANVLKQFPDLRIDIVGNCDYRMDDNYNVTLGMNRSKACMAQLVNALGVDKSRLNLITNGEFKPIIKTEEIEYLGFNRRVDFYVAGSESNKVEGKE